MHNDPAEALGTAKGLWPMSAPYGRWFGRGNCCKAGSAAMVARQKGVNLLVLALSWLHMKCPKKCPSCLAPGRPLSKKQWGVVQRLKSFLFSLEEVGDVGPAEMGRSAAKNEGLDVCFAA